MTQPSQPPIENQSLPRYFATMYGAHYDLRRGLLSQFRWPATLSVLALNVVVFAIQVSLDKFRPVAFERFIEVFSLSLHGIQQGHIWQLLTFQVLHGGYLHIFVNCWMIFVFGRAVEKELGRGRMLGLYFLSGVIGGLFQIAGPWLLPHWLKDLGAVGASAGACGLLAAFAILMPHERIIMLFPIPLLVLKPRTLVLLFAAVSLVGSFYPFWGIGHAAHLGGIVTGWFVARMLAGKLPPPIIDVEPKTSLKITEAPD